MAVTEQRQGINWQAQYLEQIQARLGSLEAGQRALDAKIEQVRKELREELRNEIGQVRAEITQVRTDLRGEINHLRATLQREIRMVIWGVAASILATIVTGALRTLQ